MKRLYLLLLTILGSLVRVSAATFTVLNTNDSGPDSLRQAILDANANPGADTIHFNIAGETVQTIAPLAQLPEITNTIAINGYSQPGSSANTAELGGVNAVLRVRLDGIWLTNGLPSALYFNTASGSSVRGLVIVRFPHGIQIYNSSSVTIAGNWIGMDVDGIARGMTFDGVAVSCPVFGAAMNNMIGGALPADRNVISGNRNGVSFSPTTAANNFVVGNFIGTDPSGRLPRGNVFSCVSIQSATNITIGGPSLGERNLLSACTGAGGRGVSIVGGGGHLIQGNHIGTDVAGFFDIGNSSDGIYAQGTRNVHISGNQIVNNGGNGIQLLGSSDCVIERNWIGTDAYSPTIFPLGNALAGVLISGGTNRVGGLGLSQGNFIEYNGGAGVAVTSGERNEISGNQIYDNGGLGIDLGASGITPNDAGDFDVGANQLQNFATITNALSLHGSTLVQGTLNAEASANFRIELFASPPFDPLGLAEGQLFLGSTNVTTDANGEASFSVMVNYAAADHLITATATDANGNTSEFSSAAPLAIGPQGVSLAIVNNGTSQTIYWPAVALQFELETTGALNSTSQWQTITSGIVTLAEWKQYVVTNGPSATNQFFRLRKP